MKEMKENVLMAQTTRHASFGPIFVTVAQRSPSRPIKTSIRSK
jgi:hypothetical protein